MATAAGQSAKAANPSGSHDWPIYGGTAENNHFSPLSQINRKNVTQLNVAWTFDYRRGGGLQTSPIEVEGVLYGLTPRKKCLRSSSGQDNCCGSLIPASRGRSPIVAWPTGPMARDRRILVGVMNFVYALDAATGKPISSFGKDGRIDLREDLGRDPASQSIYLTSPAVIYKDLMIVGGRESETLPASPGDVRAYDVRTGNLALVVSHDPASRRIRLRHLAERCMEDQRRSQQLGRHDGGR